MFYRTLSVLHIVSQSACQDIMFRKCVGLEEFERKGNMIWTIQSNCSAINVEMVFTNSIKIIQKFIIQTLNFVIAMIF